MQFDIWVRKIPWRRKWQHSPVFLPGKSHGRRSLAGYSPRGCKEIEGHALVTEQQMRKLRSGSCPESQREFGGFKASLAPKSVLLTTTLDS